MTEFLVFGRIPGTAKKERERLDLKFSIQRGNARFVRRAADALKWLERVSKIWF
jgi:hypothetical protein